ncbi:copper homeostasis protein CutC [Gluconobacter japonicus]|uniref:PF03932 family protein CutC n=1 Tax=Gluconobacter japonicus TaxID=376620 RepID=A0A9Q2FN99_GLUJA|nr:copper homeostasis protein CutC [Gluconobacter japonicus]KXV27319.1 copper homeostasis protein CutC [Gluconobacter japonicus]KXV39664.1 copper homeostasis protein CutC [Gluconobacter japonicus]MBF0870433.1 copper homeostasis protein CutC [Gluconobacter japonicus]GAD10115.1 copper homeostasis protein cutc [Gluconobacter frateurii NBRC 103465]
MPTLEICVEDAVGLRTAQRPGVTRIELCSALALGGLTPSAGLMRLAGQSTVPVYAMIRPREGGFVFTAEEIDQMLADIDAARTAGLAGVVLGACTSDRTLDVQTLKLLSDACGGMGRTLHRVFDLTPNPLTAVDQAVDLGFERILTSGQAVIAPKGQSVLKNIVNHSAGRIEIMAGSGVRVGNVRELVQETGVTAIHASCRGPSVGQACRVWELGFGRLASRTSGKIIDQMLAILAEDAELPVA